MNVHHKELNHEERQKEFISLMKKNKLTREETANILNISLSTISCWLSKPTSKRYRRIKSNTLSLFKYILNHKRDGR